MGDRFVKVAQKGNGEDGLRVPVATDLNKGSWTFVNTSASSKGLAPAVHPQRLS